MKICVCNCVSVTCATVVFATVTDVGDEDPTFPSPSVAVALMLYGPSATLVVFQLTEYGEAVTTPSDVVPAKNSTWTTCRGSCTVALRVTVPLRLPTGAVRVTTGGAFRTGGVEPTSMRP